MTWHIMVTEISIKNRLDALLRPIVGINHVRNAPLIKAEDNNIGYIDRLCKQLSKSSYGTSPEVAKLKRLVREYQEKQAKKLVKQGSV